MIRLDEQTRLEAPVATRRTAVIGADGFIGSRLYASYLPHDSHTLGTSRRRGSKLLNVDLANSEVATLRMRDWGIQDVVDSAAMARMADCEAKPELAWRVNCDNVLAMAQRLAEWDIKTIVYSTDTVFDGRDGGYDDLAATSPLNIYGKTKARLESELPKTCGNNYLVIRLSKIYDLVSGDGTMFDEIAGKLLQGIPVRAASDQCFCPTFVDDVVKATTMLQAVDARGIVNVCASEAVRRYDVALRLAERLGVDRQLVQPISLDDLNESFRRPKNVAMVCRRLSELANVTFLPLESALSQVVENCRQLRKSA